MAEIDKGKDMRFSDEKLYQFHNDFQEHVVKCEERFTSGDKQFKELIDAQQKNTEAIALLIKETRDIVQLHKDIQATFRISNGVQLFLSWVLKWPLIGTGLYAAISWIVKHIN